MVDFIQILKKRYPNPPQQEQTSDITIYERSDPTHYFGRGPNELLANVLVMFVAFIPFFAFKELGRVLGEGRVWELFFRRRADH